MGNSTRYRGYWLSRVGLTICGVAGLSLAGMGAFVSERLGAPRRVLGVQDLARLTRDNALQILTMDESLLESYRGVLHSVVKAILAAAALVMIGAVLCGIGVFRSRRGLAGLNRSSPASEAVPEISPSGGPESD